MEYDNNLRGVLFKNDRKNSPNHPDYKGSAEIEGQQYWMSAWIKEGKTGAKRMSISFKPKDEQTTKENPIESRYEDDAFPNDDVPF